MKLVKQLTAVALFYVIAVLVLSSCSSSSRGYVVQTKFELWQGNTIEEAIDDLKPCMSKLDKQFGECGYAVERIREYDNGYILDVNKTVRGSERGIDVVVYFDEGEQDISIYLN